MMKVELKTKIGMKIIREHLTYFLAYVSGLDEFIVHETERIYIYY